MKSRRLAGDRPTGAFLRRMAAPWLNAAAPSRQCTGTPRWRLPCNQSQGAVPPARIHAARWGQPTGRPTLMGCAFRFCRNKFRRCWRCRLVAPGWDRSRPDTTAAVRQRRRRWRGKQIRAPHRHSCSALGPSAQGSALPSTGSQRWPQRSWAAASTCRAGAVIKSAHRPLFPLTQRAPAPSMAAHARRAKLNLSSYALSTGPSSCCMVRSISCRSAPSSGSYLEDGSGGMSFRRYSRARS